MALTTIPDKATSDELTAAEFNEILDAIKDGTLEINTAGLRIAGTVVTPSAAELNFVDGVTSAIQTQMDAKAPVASPTFTGTVTVPASNFTVGASAPFADAAGSLTLQNVDALDPTTEATVEAAIDTLANLVSIQGRTVTLADAGADAFLGWDDSASAYENLTQAEARTILGLSTAAYVATDLADLNEATIEGAIDTLANLTSIQGRTVTLTDAGADAIFGWDDTAGAYENLTAQEVLDVLGITASATELNYLDIATLGTGAANKAVVLDAGDDYTWPATGILTYGGTGITATGAEINVLDGIPGTLTATELGYVDGVTSAIQTQLDGKYAVGGTDVSMADGGTGASLADPGADRILFWDDSAGAMTWLTASTGLTISTTNMTVRTSSATQTGIVELATDAETVTGTDTARATTPANITAKMAAPGAIGGTTPAAGTFTTLTGAATSVTSLDVNNGNITEIKQAIYNGVVDDGNSSTADTIDWSTGSIHKSTLTGNVTYTFTAPTGVSRLTLMVYSGAGSFTTTWPATVKWPDATAPTMTTAASKVDIITFIWDGTNYWGVSTQNFSA